MLPDLSGAEKLKWLYLSGCESLREVQPSVFSKDTLVTLLLDGCKKLEILVSENHLTSLQNINISSCSSLREFSLSSDLIEELDLSNTGIEILHPSIGRMSKLWKLDLQGLRLKNLPKEMSCMRSLTELDLSNCNVVTKSKLEAIFGGLESLKILYLKDCGNLLELPVNVDFLSSLYELRLDGSNVKMLPSSVKNLSSLQILSLDNCKKLGCLSEVPPLIEELHVSNCTSLVKVSSLKALSKCMKGVKKDISFKNSIKLDAPSLNRITEDVILTMKSAAFHNTITVSSGYGCSYSRVHVWLPGCTVPNQFKFRTIGSSSSITVELPQVSKHVGFIFSAVVSPSFGMAEHGNKVRINVRCHNSAYGHGDLVCWHYIKDVSLDHVIMCYDLAYYSMNVVEFSVTSFSGDLIGSYILKECGVYPIHCSEFPRLAATINLDKDLEREIALKLSRMFGSDLNESTQFESDSIERYDDDDDERRLANEIDESVERCDEKESTCIQKNQQDSDSNERCSCSSNECLMGMKTFHPLSQISHVIIFYCPSYVNVIKLSRDFLNFKISNIIIHSIYL